MRIVADENIPYVREAFCQLGEVHTVAGRQIQPATVKQADILLVRSVTPVNESLLAGSQVRFVGTATIGCDHVDLDYLAKHQIAFANAPGSNAISTAEYVISALFVLAERQAFKLHDKTVGIIGCGNVGSQVLQKLQSLNVSCQVYDPLLQTPLIPLTNLETVLSAKIITLHVPLTNSGDYATEHMVNETFLAQLADDAILINTSRGKIIEEDALQARLNQATKMTVVLDVWNHEPLINLALLDKTALSTPHIAGYSIEGKARGTEILYKAICAFLKKTPTWVARYSIPPPPLSQLTFTPTIEDNQALRIAVMACYDIRSDDATLRHITQTTNPNEYFDTLRKHYPLRREFKSIQIKVPLIKNTLIQQLTGLGFQIIPY